MSISEVEEILTVPECVDIYHLVYLVDQNKHRLSSAVIRDATFRVFRERLSDGIASVPNQRLALIKCQNWYFPLEYGKTKIYRCRERQYAYIFPDENCDDAYSIVIIKQNESHVTRFEDVLRSYALIQESPEWWKAIPDDLESLEPGEFVLPTAPMLPPQFEPEARRPSGTAQTIAKGIVTGADVLNTGITKGTQVVGGLVTKGGQQWRGNQQPLTGDNQAKIDPRVITGLHGLRVASEAACSATGFCVNAVTKGTQALGSRLAPHIRSHGTRMVSKVSGKDENSSKETVENVLTVAAGGLQGFATLYNGITENAKTLAKTVANETVNIVNVKYGTDAGQATHEALYAAGNAALTAQNVQHLGPKAIAKNAATETGKTVLKNHLPGDGANQKT